MSSELNEGDEPVLRIPPTKSGRVINASGPHSDEAFRFNKRDVNEEAAKQTQMSALEVCRNLVDPDKPGRRTSLIFGMIQSGKTHALCQSLALAADNGFRLFLVLTSDNNTLYSQTAKRLKHALPMMRFLTKDDLKSQDRPQTVDLLKDAIKSPRRCAVIFVSKNRRVLDDALTVLKQANAAKIPTAIFDDEADQASLNAKAFEPAPAGGRTLTDLSAINATITKIRDFLQTHSYVQVTATPQSLFIQGYSNAFRPEHHVVLDEGKEYQGSEHFLVTHPKAYWREVDEDEVNQYQNLDLTLEPELLAGMKKAVAAFLIGSAMRLLEDEAAGRDRGKYSMLMHTTMRQQEHKKLRGSVFSYITNLERILPDHIPPEFREAYNDLSASVQKSGLAPPTLDDAVRVVINFGLTCNLREVNATTTRQIDFTDPDNYQYCNIFIGGNVLGRGMTIRGLITTYYGRGGSQPQIDTVLQHARWYGYRMKLAPYIRLFMPASIWSRFNHLHYHDRELRQAALRYLENKTPIIPLFIPSKMSPTRDDVIDPGSLGAYPGGVAIFSKLPDVRAAQAATQKIDAFMAKTFGGQEPPNETERLVAIIDKEEAVRLLNLLPQSSDCKYGTWVNEAVSQGITTVCSTLETNKVRLVWGKGMERNRSADPDSAGHIQTFLLSKEREKYHLKKDPNVVTLFLFKIRGDTYQTKEGKPIAPGWGDGPWNHGDPVPKPRKVPDFYVPGVAWPELIRDEGYAICFRLES